MRAVCTARSALLRRVCGMRPRLVDSLPIEGFGWPRKRVNCVSFTRYRRMKAPCALVGVNVADVVRGLVNERFGAAARD